MPPDFCENYANRFEASQHSDATEREGVDTGDEFPLDNHDTNYDDHEGPVVQEGGDVSFNTGVCDFSGGGAMDQAAKSPPAARAAPKDAPVQQSSRRSVPGRASASEPKRKKAVASDVNTVCTIDIVTGGMHISRDSRDLIMHRIRWENYDDPDWWQSQLTDYDFSDQYVGQVFFQLEMNYW